MASKKNKKKTGRKSVIDKMGGMSKLKEKFDNFIIRMADNAKLGNKPLFLTHFLVENELGKDWWKHNMEHNKEFRALADVMLTHLEHHFLHVAMELSGNFLKEVKQEGNVITKTYETSGYNAGFVKLYFQNTFDYVEKVDHTGGNPLEGMAAADIKKVVKSVMDMM